MDDVENSKMDGGISTHDQAEVISEEEIGVESGHGTDSTL
jgi:hypothetical protein